ncbi:MAG TPA: sigma factor [Candidatus Dormibacteraeota bacterium]|nr:sigma factor [Candidatus Dormibacteraeota bacterium]
MRTGSSRTTATYDRLFAMLIVLLHDRAAAEDCVQETCFRAFKAWPRWQPGAPAEVWLHRIAINVALSHPRRERLRDVSEVVRRMEVRAILTRPSRLRMS